MIASSLHRLLYNLSLSSKKVAMSSQQQMLLEIDADGMFTDFVLVRPEPIVSVRVNKTLSTPDAPERAILHDIKAMGL